MKLRKGNFIFNTLVVPLAARMRLAGWRPALTTHRLSCGPPPLERGAPPPEGHTKGCDNLVAAVEVTDAEGRTAAQIADEKMLREGGFGADGCTAPIAGKIGR